MKPRPIRRPHVRPVELVPRHNGADVHEAAKVEQDIHARVDLVVARFGLAEELAVPVHGVANDKTGEEVVGAEHAADADKEEA